MDFVSTLLVWARRLSRRHRVVTALCLASLVAVIFLLTLSLEWTPESLAALVSVKPPDDSCRWLPGFVCDWRKQQSSTSSTPYDPKVSKPSSTPKASALPESDKKKLEFIRSYYTKLKSNKQKLEIGQKFYDSILTTVRKAKPDSVLAQDYPVEKLVSKRYELRDTTIPTYSKTFLSGFLKLSDKEFNDLKASHDYVIDKLPQQAPLGLYSGDGIVYVGGGKFNWLTLLSIRALRAEGCLLPIEILIPTIDEYELELCSRVFPAMNARCIYLPMQFRGEQLSATKLEFSGYQYKCLAILLSSFENVLLLDSDNVAAYAPDHLFNKEPFVSTGLIVWPDFWKRSTSPDYFKIANVKLSQTELLPRYDEVYGEYHPQTYQEPLDLDNTPLHERVGAIPEPSSESGQLMISKKTHMKELLLALYYNYYGPSHYYPLFSQGAQGEGDKETFLAATIVTKGSYYQVGKFLDALGNVRKDAFNGNGMGQFDPVEDLAWQRKKEKLRTEFSGDVYYEEVKKLQKPKMLFVHANVPKLNPWSMKNEHDTVDEDGNRYRLYGLGMRERTGADFEGIVWGHMDTLLCELNLNINAFKEIDRKALCTEIKTHREWLKSTEHTLE